MVEQLVQDTAMLPQIHLPCVKHIALLPPLDPHMPIPSLTEMAISQVQSEQTLLRSQNRCQMMS